MPKTLEAVKFTLETLWNSEEQTRVLSQDPTWVTQDFGVGNGKWKTFTERLKEGTELCDSLDTFSLQIIWNEFEYKSFALNIQRDLEKSEAELSEQESVLYGELFGFSNFPECKSTSESGLWF